MLGCVRKLAAIGVKVHCLQLGGTDLTSAAGRMTMNVLAAVAQFERDLLIERAQAGLQRPGQMARSLADAPPSATISAPRGSAGGRRTVSALARRYETSRQTILRAKTAVEAAQ